MSFFSRFGKTIAIVLVCSGAAFYAGWQAPSLLGGMFEQKQPAPPVPKFYPLDRFVISMPGQKYEHYVLLEMALKSSTPDAEKILKEADPLVRNTMMKMFSGKQVSELNKPANLDSLQTEAKKLLNKVLKSNNFDMNIGEVLFTRLVIQ